MIVSPIEPGALLPRGLLKSPEPKTATDREVGFGKKSVRWRDEECVDEEVFTAMRFWKMDAPKRCCRNSRTKLSFLGGHLDRDDRKFLSQCAGAVRGAAQPGIAARHRPLNSRR